MITKSSRPVGATTPTRRGAVAAALTELAPALPPFETGVIVDRAIDSRGLSSARPLEAAWLALVAYVRHAMTDYDALLEDGYDQDSARFFVLDDINTVLERWGARRRVSGDEPIPDEQPGNLG